MDIIQALTLSVIQGLTEFLPISSSGHLVIARELLQWPDAGVAFDAFTGLGTLTAVVIYYWQDVKSMISAWLMKYVRHRHIAEDRLSDVQLGNHLIIATIPTLILGFIVEKQIDNQMHNILVIAVSCIVFAVLLQFADYYGSKQKRVQQVSIRDALYFGLAQMIALIPGVSRSGITLTAGLAMGYSRKSAARFSFLMSIPISAAAGIYGLVKLVTDAQYQINWQLLALSYVVSTLTAFICIAVFIQFINRVGMWPFTIYRLLLGIVLLCFYSI